MPGDSPGVINWMFPLKILTIFAEALGIQKVFGPPTLVTGISESLA